MKRSRKELKKKGEGVQQHFWYCPEPEIESFCGVRTRISLVFFQTVGGVGGGSRKRPLIGA